MGICSIPAAASCSRQRLDRPTIAMPRLLSAHSNRGSFPWPGSLALSWPVLPLFPSLCPLKSFDLVRQPAVFAEAGCHRHPIAQALGASSWLGQQHLAQRCAQQEKHPVLHDDIPNPRKSHEVHHRLYLLGSARLSGGGDASRFLLSTRKEGETQMQSLQCRRSVFLHESLGAKCPVSS